MNLPASSDFSFYQLVQGIDPTLPTLMVNPSTLKAVVGAMVDFLIEQQLSAIVWIKLPLQADWIATIEYYQQQGKADKIYLCSTRKESLSLLTSTDTVIVPVILETSAQLKREYFWIVLSEEFYSLLLVQQASAKTTETETETLWKLIYSFDKSLIERVLAQIKQGITITDTTPEELLTDADLPFTLATTANSKLLQSLLLKQIQHTEAIQTDMMASFQGNLEINAINESLHFKNEILRNLAQELRLPLTNMKTALRLLESMQSKREQRQRYLNLLQRECDRQSFLLVGLQEFIQFDQTPLKEVNVSLKLEDVIPGIVSTYQPLAEEKGILLGYTIPAGFPPVACPESWLRQILLNLLSNSLKFTHSNGRVYVQAALKQDAVELTVSDTGVGIEPNDLPKIFNSFYRGRNTLIDGVHSAGLGLTIVKQLLTRCGGSIVVNSKTGKGTTFTISLPVVLLESEEHFS